MATISVGASGRRSVDHDLPLVPFIDFLLCLIAFLLVTAVWAQMARLTANANVPGEPSPIPDVPTKELHVKIGERHFDLAWKRGATVLETKQIALEPLTLPDGSLRYPELQATLADEWKNQGDHRSANDERQDRAVLHTGNSTSFGVLAAVIDAMNGPKRPYAGSHGSIDVPAFSVSFATD